MTRRGPVRLIFACELRRCLRDRRAVLFGLVLPIVAFPLIFLFSDRLERVGRDALEARELMIAHDLRALAPDAARALERELADPAARFLPLALELDAPPTPDEARARLAADHVALLVVAAAPETPGDPPRLLLLYDDADEASEEARDRAAAAAQRVLLAARAQALAAAGGDPGARFDAQEVDVARPGDAAGRRLGSLLPLLAVLALLSGGSFAALDAFAGEREAGTLETLLVQPAPARAIAQGKFLVVLAIGLVAFLGNALSLSACLRLGLGDLGDVGRGVDWARASARIALGCALFLPTAVLAAAVLALAAARARTFRQGQLLTMPLTFAALALAAPALQPTTESSVLLALVPVTGGALALRDAAAGALAPAAFATCVLASSAWAALALSRLARTLDAERLLAAPDAARIAGRRSDATRAIRFGLVAALVLYVAGGRLQAASPLAGLVATLWVLTLGLALLAARGPARAALARAGGPRPTLAAALGLARPGAAHALGAVLCAPALAQIVERLFRLQQDWLPMPSRIGEAAGLVAWIQDLDLPVLLLVLAVSPAICEELLFRGALLTAMRGGLGTRAILVWQAVLFGAVHASIYRFLPTALCGAALAAVALRARSVIASMLLHGAYNAVLVAATAGGIAWIGSPWLALLALPGVALLARPRPESSAQRG